MKISVKNLFLCLIILLLSCMYLFSINIINHNIIIISSFILIGLISLIGIFKDKYTFSLNKMFWFFNLFFLFFAPMLQYLTDYKMWGYDLNEKYIMKANCFIIIWLLIYMLVSLYYKPQKIKSTILEFSNNNYVLLFISIISSIILINNVGFMNLFSRENLVVSLSNNTLINEMIAKLFMTAPIFTFAIYILNIQKRNQNKNIFILIILLFLILITNFPFSITRYWVGVVYIGLFCLIFKNKITGRKFDYIIIIILIIAFPFIQLFKWYSFKEVLKMDNVINVFGTCFNGNDFDAYSMFGRIIKYVNDNSLTYGKQLLSCLAFMLPRSVWPEKPYPTGQIVAESQNAIYTNVSSPLISEAYINYGILGIVTFAIFFSVIVKKLDYSYWNNEKHEVTYLDIYYPFLIGFMIFLQRGSLQPVIVYMFYFFLFLIIHKICRKVVFKNEK